MNIFIQYPLNIAAGAWLAKTSTEGSALQCLHYRGVTLLRVVGKVFCKVLNNRLVHCLDKGGVLHEGQAGFRVNRSCMVTL